MKQKMISLRLKLLFAIVWLVLVLSTIIVCVSYFTYKNTMNEHYETLGNNVARTAISLFDEEQMRAFTMGVFEGDQSVMQTEEYQRVLSLLKDLKDSNDVLYLYMIYPTENGSYFLFDTDESEEACPYGFFMEYYEGSFDSIVGELIAGNNVPAVISDEEYGWIISISYPYKSSDGELIGYVCADISMDKVVKDRQNYLLGTLLILACVTAAFAVLYYILFNYVFVRPIKRMAGAAAEFVSGGQDGEFSSSISQLTVRSHDELHLLCDSLKTMELNIREYVNNLREVTSEKERIGAELDVARHIQSSMLPCIFPAFPERREFDIYATMTPAKEVGGDFYDFFMVDERHLAVVMADVSGKGVPAALFMVIGKTLIKDHTTPGRDLGEVFGEVNRLLCESNSEGLFITAFEGVLDLATGEFRFVNAGHEMPFIGRANIFSAEKIRPGFVLAGMEETRYRAGVLYLNEGDKFFEYTDGVTEATDAQNELYGMARLEAVLSEHVGDTPQEICAAVKQDIDAFVKDAPQFDDITMLCLEFRKKCRLQRRKGNERTDS